MFCLLAFHAFHMVFGWPRGRAVTPRYNQWLDDVEGIASVFQGCPKIAETRNDRRTCWAMSNFWTTFCFCWLIFVFPRDILERMKLILHYFWLRYLPRESEKFANLALFRAFPSLAFRGLTFGLNSANQRLCFWLDFTFFFIVKELLSPSWKKVSPIESVLPVWFCFEREKKIPFSNSTWSNQFCLCFGMFGSPPRRRRSTCPLKSAERGWWRSFSGLSSLDTDLC